MAKVPLRAVLILVQTNSLTWCCNTYTTKLAVGNSKSQRSLGSHLTSCVAMPLLGKGAVLEADTTF